MRNLHYNCDPYRLELDVYNEQDLDKYRLESDIYNDQVGTEPIGGYSNTGCPDRYCSVQVLDSYRLESDLPASGQSCIDISKPMGQLLESLEDLNQNIKSGFNIVTVCSDNWKQIMYDHLSVHDDRLSRLDAY